ncbi:hypothetical protein HX069_12205 [Myroides odoratimimus]|uniref:hypothetical protein n=1 Tax=Myroides odoratimimus TaxID=76832 RepID=UPI002578559D|nr:hypothetical protein [Myroides odoratimimus]MDM1679911.1 hypothetical protein [Myroides odoratimimus]
MNDIKLKYQQFIHESKRGAIKSIKKCYYPGCLEPSINSHILQKNGILSKIAKDNHLWEHVINEFKEESFQFKRTGINEIFSFKCFCKTHDNMLFKKIELGEINFMDYNSCLLFTLRTIYNEIFRKEVNLMIYNDLLKSGFVPEENLFFLKETIKQEELGRLDLEANAFDIWNDLKGGGESFIFEVRSLLKIDLCLSAFFNYETTLEMNSYKLNYGKDMNRVSEIFINFFPYNNESILLMGYNKKDEKKVKPYFNTFFKESEKRVQRKLTNLFLFACETWVISDGLYNKKIKGIEEEVIYASKYSMYTYNERHNFPLNIFIDSFKSDIKKWYLKNNEFYN